MSENATRRLALAGLTLGLGCVAFRVAREWFVGGEPPVWVKLTGAGAFILILASIIVLMPDLKK